MALVGGELFIQPLMMSDTTAIMTVTTAIIARAGGQLLR